MRKFLDNVLPFVWGGAWVAIITLGSVGVLIAVVKWILGLIGVL